jgi:hypothetical protein
MPIITVKEAIDLAADKVGKSGSQNRSEILFLLDRAQETAWNRGMWWGFYREVKLKVWGDHIVMPQDFGVLYAINVNGRPTIPRNRWYEFHQNGHGSIEDCLGDKRCNWVRSVVDMGEQAVPFQPCGKKLHVRSRGCEEAGKFVVVNGRDHNDDEIYTYYAKEEASSGSSCASCDGRCYTKDEVANGAVTEYETQYGERIPIKNEKIVETRTYFSHIESITKPVTQSPVDIWVTDGDSSELLVTMAPHQTTTSFRKYRLPDTCDNCRCVHVLGKINEPQPLSYDSQPLIIQSRAALINLVISADYEFNKRMPTEADAFLERGLKALDLNLAEKTGPRNLPLQIVTPDLGTREDYEFIPYYQ